MPITFSNTFLEDEKNKQICDLLTGPVDKFLPHDVISEFYIDTKVEAGSSPGTAINAYSFSALDIAIVLSCDAHFDKLLDTMNHTRKLNLREKKEIITNALITGCMCRNIGSLYKLEKYISSLETSFLDNDTSTKLNKFTANAYLKEPVTSISKTIITNASKPKAPNNESTCSIFSRRPNTAPNSRERDKFPSSKVKSGKF